MSNALSIIAATTGTTPEEIKEVLSGMIISAKGQHGAKATDAELAVVSGVCATYGLNPLVKEAHAFISGGKLQVMIGIDGWIKIMNRHPEFDGVDFDYEWDGRKLISVTTKIYTKSRRHPVHATEWMDECKQAKSDAWAKYEKRMLRNKSLGQCIRLAFGISEIIDNDEADRIKTREREINPAPNSQASNVNWSAIDDSMGKCNTEEQLKEVSSGIRQDMEKRGIWDKEKHLVIEMNIRHKERIANIKPAEDEGAVIEGELVNDDVSFD